MFVQPLLLALKCIPHAKYEKNLLIMPVSLLFFHNIGPNLAQILPQDHTHFILFFFAVFQWNMLGDSIGIKNFNWNPVVLKKICQTIFQPNLHQKGLSLSHSQNQNLFFFFHKQQNQIISFQKRFILWKYQMFWLSYECFSIVCDAFLLKRVISSHNSCAE